MKFVPPICPPFKHYQKRTVIKFCHRSFLMISTVLARCPSTSQQIHDLKNYYCSVFTIKKGFSIRKTFAKRIGNTSFARQDIRLTRCPVGKVSSRQGVRSARCPVNRQGVRSARCPLDNVSVGRMSIGKMYVVRIRTETV